MKLVPTTYARGKTQVTAVATPKQVRELKFCLDAIRMNQKTYGDVELDGLSVGAYKSLKELFEIIGIY